MNVPRVDFAEFEAGFNWQQGDHVTLIGQTKSGKTTLARYLLDQRDYVVVIATKPRDDILPGFRERGYKIVRTLPLPDHQLYPRVVFWPPNRRIEDAKRQKEQIRDALKQYYMQGGDAIYVDEVHEVAKEMNLEPILNLLWARVRTSKGSLIAAAQRPADNPMMMYSQANHIFFFRTQDPYDVMRIGGYGINRRMIARTVRELDADQHEFLYLNTWQGTGCISALPPALAGDRLG